MIAPLTTSVGLALVVVHARDGRATVRSVAAEAGVSVGTVHKHLSLLEDTGLVLGLGSQGGLRPGMSVVAHTPLS